MKIKELILDTKNLEKQIAFYQEVLEFELINQTKISASFQVGKSILTFTQNSNATPYHFAFNIPVGKEQEALEWLKKRVVVIPFENNEIIDFKNWKAKAIYFYDKDNNIVEFIARKELATNIDDVKFNSQKVINISEMAIGTDDIEKIYGGLNEIKPIPIFDGGFDRFCALGNNEGLFIVVDIQKKDWFPTGDRIHISDFTMKGDHNFEYRNGELKELYNFIE